MHTSNVCIWDLIKIHPWAFRFHLLFNKWKWTLSLNWKKKS